MNKAIIKLKSDGEFYLKNIGKSLVFVNGKPITTGYMKRVDNNSLIEVGNGKCNYNQDISTKLYF